MRKFIIKRAIIFSLLATVIMILAYTCTKEEIIYTCGDRNGDGVEDERDCIGRDGVDGKDGADGSVFIYDLLSENLPSTVCDGYVIFFWADINGSGEIEQDADRLLGEVPVCNGAAGADGADGQDGADGTNGESSVVTTKTFSFPPDDECLNGGTLFEIYVNNELMDSFRLCNGLDGEDFVYNHSYEVLLDPGSCGEGGGRQIKIYNEADVLIEQVDLCFGMTYQELKDLVIPIRKYFADVSTIYKEIQCDHGIGYEVWVSIDDAEVLHFFICPPDPGL